MKYLFTLFIATILCSCENGKITVENPQNETTVSEITKLQTDTSYYKVIVTENQSLKVFDKNNTLTYNLDNETGIAKTLGLILFILITCVFVISSFNID